MATAELENRLTEYLNRERKSRENRLGFGEDGIVWRTSTNSAVKVFQREKNYRLELECYERLKAEGVKIINELNVPELENHCDELMIVEMSIVKPPFLLDFGKVYLDNPIEHTDEVMREHEERLLDLWGDRLPSVKAVLWKLESMGIYYQDPKPGNIVFGDQDYLGRTNSPENDSV